MKNFLPATILYVCVLIVKKCCCGVFELEKGGELKWPHFTKYTSTTFFDNFVQWLNQQFVCSHFLAEKGLCIRSYSQNKFVFYWLSFCFDVCALQKIANGSSDCFNRSPRRVLVVASRSCLQQHIASYYWWLL